MNKRTYRIVIDFDVTDDDNGDVVQDDLYSMIDTDIQRFDGGDGLLSCTYRIEEARVEWQHIDGYSKDEI